MSATPFGDDRLTMLMACASPGSAFAYHLGLATFGPAVLRRGKAMESDPVPEPAMQDPAPACGTEVENLIASGRVLALP